MLSFSQLFQFYDKGEMAMLAVGVFFCAVAGIAFPCINIAFGELLGPPRRCPTSRRLQSEPCFS